MHAKNIRTSFESKNTLKTFLSSPEAKIIKFLFFRLKSDHFKAKTVQFQQLNQTILRLKLSSFNS